MFMSASVIGSIAPAVWSFCLAERACGLGTCLTTLHLLRESETAKILGIPYESVRSRCFPWRTRSAPTSGPLVAARWTRSCTSTAGEPTVPPNGRRRATWPA
jgi:hypothetical protein